MATSPGQKTVHESTSSPIITMSHTTNCQTDIYSVLASGGQPAKITSFRHGRWRFISESRWKASGVLCIDKQTCSVLHRAGSVGDGPRAKCKPQQNLTADFDFDVGAGVGGDNTAPRGGGGNPPVWSADGKRSGGLWQRRKSECWRV